VNNKSFAAIDVKHSYTLTTVTYCYSIGLLIDLIYKVNGKREWHRLVIYFWSWSSDM